MEGDEVPVVLQATGWERQVPFAPLWGEGKPTFGTAFVQGLGCAWWLLQNNGELWCLP